MWIIFNVILENSLYVSIVEDEFKWAQCYTVKQVMYVLHFNAASDASDASDQDKENNNLDLEVLGNVSSLKGCVSTSHYNVKSSTSHLPEIFSLVLRICWCSVFHLFSDTPLFQCVSSVQGWKCKRINPMRTDKEAISLMESESLILITSY